MDCTHLHNISVLDRTYRKRNYSCIYAIFSTVTGKKYVGSAKHFGIRMRNHVHQLINGKHHSIILQNHVNKYGIEDMYFVILEFCKWDNTIFQREQFYVTTLEAEFNVLKTIRGEATRKVSKETIEKLVKSHLGKKRKPESIAKMKETMKVWIAEMSEEKKENRRKANHLKRKKVVCNETKIVYNSITEAEKITGCDNISQIVNGTRKHSFGFTFSFYGL
jgi:group I intron endonuclease